MKTIPSSLQTHLAGTTTTMCTCWILTRRDGVSFYFTDHMYDVVINGNTFKASSGLTRTAMSRNNSLSVDNFDIMGILDSDEITGDDVRAGLYRDAELWILEADYTSSPTNDYIELDYGFLGEAKINGISGFNVEFRSLAQRLDQEIGSKYSRYCRYNLGDNSCGIVIAPSLTWSIGAPITAGDLYKPLTYNGRQFRASVGGTTDTFEPSWDTTIGNPTTDNDVTWICEDMWTKEGAVTTVISQRQISTNLSGFADNWFKYGIITFTSGANSGLSFDVKSYTSTSGVVETVFAIPFIIAVSDTFEISAGCNHLLRLPADTKGSPFTGDCRAKFDNVLNFGGHPSIPGNDFLVRGE